MSTAADRTGRRGIALASLRVEEAGYTFREKTTSDFGIDAEIETTSAQDRPTGNLLAVQVKAGKHCFKRPDNDGWWYPVSQKKHMYWSGYCLPVVLLLVNVDTGDVFWQVVEPATTISTGKNWKIHVPRRNTLATAQDVWPNLAGGRLARARETFALTQNRLPPAATRHLAALADQDPDVASLLAHHLALADSAEQATRSLLRQPPRWLAEAPALAWKIVGGYAVEHDYPALGASAYEKAAERDAGAAGTLLATAGINLMGSQPKRAKRLLSRALKTGGDQLTARLGLTILAHPSDDATAIAEPPELTGTAADTSVVAQQFLAENSIRRADLNAAVAHHRAALALAPDSSSAMLRLASALLRRHITANAQPADLGEALSLAEQALAQRHMWSGPTTDALAAVVQALWFLGDYPALLSRALPAPLGTATAAESCNEDIGRFAAPAAHLLGRDDLVRDILSRLPKGTRRTLLALQLDQPPDDPVTAHEELLEQALAEDEPEVAVTAVLRLAHLGHDRTDALTDAHARGVVPTEYLDVPKAIVLLARDRSAGLAALRQLAPSSIVAAEVLVQALAEAGTTDQAVAAVDAALRRHAQQIFHLLKVDVLRRAGRHDEANVAARAALLDDRLHRYERRQLFKRVAADAGARDDPHEVIRLCQSALAGTPAAFADRELVWWLIQCQLNLGAIADAWDTWDRCRLPPVEADEVQVWTALHAWHGWDDDALAAGIALARQWRADVRLAGKLLTALMLRSAELTDPAPASPSHDEADGGTVAVGADAELAAALYAEVDQYCTRHGDAALIQRLPADIDALLTQIGPPLRAKADAYRHIAAMLRQLRAPLGLLAEAARAPYAAAILHRAGGMVFAATPSPDEFDREVTAARAALHGIVVTEATALHLSAVLGRGAALRARFSTVLLPRASRQDILEALLDAKRGTRGSGMLTWNPDADVPIYADLAAADKDHLLACAVRLDNEASDCEIVPSNGEDHLPAALADMSPAWTAPLQLATDQAVPLWSDDVGLRRLAAAENIAAFGTLALLHVLQEIEPDDRHLDDTEAIDELLIDEWVADMPWDLQRTIGRAQQDDHPALLAMLTRPWRYSEPDAVAIAATGVLQARERGSVEHERLFKAVAVGLAGAMQEPERMLMLFSALLARDTRDVAADLAMYMRWLEQVAAEAGLGDLRVHLDGACAEIEAFTGRHECRVDLAQRVERLVNSTA
jgi:hypothetical protein